ncbi:MAG: hypothetical protein J5663_10355, partial [Bacteroidaceae bacterium]|nr:hypothetical protein [Bacteroidaceae bacterium]
KAKHSSDKGQVITSGGTPSSNYSLSDTHIFLPAAGCCWQTTDIMSEGEYGYYWSSTSDEKDGWQFWTLLFSSDYVRFVKYSAHHWASSVCGVCQ